MPLVPTRSAPTVQENPLTGGMQTGQRSIASPELFSGNAEQISHLGAATGQLADAYDRIKERDESEAAFQTEVKVKASAIAFEDETRKRMRGVNAKGITNEMEKFWAGQAETAGADLTPYGKRLVQKSLASARLQSLSSAGNYEAAEMDKAQSEAWVGSKLVEIDRASKSMDPAVAAVAVDTLRTKNAQQAAIKGWDADTLAAHNMQDVQALNKAMLNTYLGSNELDKAEAYLKANSNDMNVNDVLHANTLIKKQRDTREALGTATAVVQRLEAKANPSPIDRLATIAGDVNFERLNTAKRVVESGNKDHNKDGTVVTSSKGAKGRDQVMDATNADPGYGVTPAKDNSLEERSRVGKDYLGAMLKEFGGDVNKAVAAYNAGPGAVSKAISSAKDGNWLAQLPKETQDYVVKVNTAYGDGTVQPTTRPTLQDIHAEIRQRLGMANPEKLRMALDEGSRQFEENTKAIKQREDEGEAAAMKWLAANGGKFSQLPPALRSAIPPVKVDNVMTAAQKFAKGDNTTDPIVFQKMATDDTWLKGMSDAEFYTQSMKLSESNREQMATRRGTLKNGPKGQSDKDLDYTTVNSLFNNRLAQMGRDPTPKDGSDDARQVGVQREVVWNAVMAAQLQSGKKFTDVDVANTIDSLFAKNITFRNTFLGIDTGKTNTPVLSVKPGDIPSDVRDQLKKDFKARNIDATDQQLLGAYMRMKLRTPQKGAAGGW